VQPVPIVAVDLVVSDVLVDEIDQRRLVNTVALAVGIITLNGMNVSGLPFISG
jgi:hypothetical protein